MLIEFKNLYTHFIFVTFRRKPIILEENRVRIEKYITGIVNNLESKLYAIYANPDHVHFLISRAPSISEQKIASIIAESSERFINENNLAIVNFHWQQSASAFSISKSKIDSVCRYILNQPEHHRKVDFEEEYKSYLNHYQISIENYFL
jgi:REP element-mobilizing transposase RayT